MSFEVGDSLAGDRPVTELTEKWWVADHDIETARVCEHVGVEEVQMREPVALLQGLHGGAGHRIDVAAFCHRADGSVGNGRSARSLRGDEGGTVGVSCELGSKVFGRGLEFDE